MTGPGESKRQQLKVGDQLEINYQKSPQYRTIHCDGAYGGITSRALIAATFYSERNVIPRTTQRVVEEVGPDGQTALGPEVFKEGFSGLMRQLEATLVMDINAAREFYVWLGGKVADLEEAAQLPEAERVGRRQETS